MKNRYCTVLGGGPTGRVRLELALFAQEGGFRGEVRFLSGIGLAASGMGWERVSGD